MNDKELLELAAKACGLTDAKYQDGKGWMEVRYGYSEAIYSDINGGYWNPLTDDGDALRLAVRLGIDVLQLKKSKSAYANNAQVFYSDAADPYSATRRAIVRAAAELGRWMPLPKPPKQKQMELS
jgi:hypothetical protein